MNRIELKFKELKKSNKKAFIAFITAGYPDLAVTEKLIMEFDKVGVDIIELGVPFTDPMADGPVIQEASQRALKNGVRLVDIVRLVKKVRSSRKVTLPICLMTYFNPVFCYPEVRFIREAASAGVDGLIIPDLPPEESRALLSSARGSRLDVIQFLAPTSTPQRIKSVAKGAKGFIYYVSLTGTTGARKNIPKDLKDKLRTIKKFTSLPVCVGFGISTAAQVRQICRLSDGAIIGSAIVKKIKENIGRADLAKRVGRYVCSLKG